ncbi:MAG: bifunctional diaminohydroxyphosphoribosylaminopyrimidine deaminase/5-amino-6-(5-phosphoribosylamino)uracil reductase RibD [Blastocatellia bacterium]|nr:bifunctional diaminohydroxyphosphoribosylaminopyrimidine deaminase/5-amino-6-(5-phosphoribosylamino)uracil reductase RibD [Blastocatellia bacterium]
MTDLEYIRLTLRLAAQGAGLVSPNPLVGSVVVSEGEIVGRGHHRYDDLKHAEVWALEEAGERARDATVYVNLEPCSHQGAGKRTPPCVKALIDAGVRRVVASMVDPNPRVDGRGFDQLRQAGIEVSVGTLEGEARRLNEAFIKYVTTGLPFVHLKTACSIDGRIATRAGESKWITGPEARAASQGLRHRTDAILVGVGTVLADDPLLTDRTGLPRRRPLVRVVLDSLLRTPLDSQLVRTARQWPTLVFAVGGDAAALERAGVEVIHAPAVDGRVDPLAALAELSRRGLISILVEGGAEVAGTFVERRLIDKATFFLAPRIIGGREAFPAIGARGFDRLSDSLALRDLDVARHGDDWEFTGYPIS